MPLSIATNPAGNGRWVCNASKLVAGTECRLCALPVRYCIAVDTGSVQRVPCTSRDAQRLMVACYLLESKRTIRRNTKDGGEASHRIARQSATQPVARCSLVCACNDRVPQRSFPRQYTAESSCPRRIAMIVKRRMVTPGYTQGKEDRKGISQLTSQSSILGQLPRLRGSPSFRRRSLGRGCAARLSCASTRHPCSVRPWGSDRRIAPLG